MVVVIFLVLSNIEIFIFFDNGVCSDQINGIGRIRIMKLVMSFIVVFVMKILCCLRYELCIELFQKVLMGEQMKVFVICMGRQVIKSVMMKMQMFLVMYFFIVKMWVMMSRSVILVKYVVGQQIMFLVQSYCRRVVYEFQKFFIEVKN